FHRRRREVNAGSGLQFRRRDGRQTHLDAAALSVETLTEIGESLIDRVVHAVANLVEIALRREFQNNFTPAEVDSRDLLEQAGSRLENDGVRERDDSSGRLSIGGDVAQFEQVESH